MKNLRAKAAGLMILSALLFCLPVAGITGNQGNTAVVYADSMEVETVAEETAETALTDGETAGTETTYVSPNVKITIKTPSASNSGTAKVPVKVEDTLDTGNFIIQKVEAKVKPDDNWTDITDEMYMEITEDCTVYVQVTDQNGKTYTKKRKITCFDYEKPTLNAAVSDGLLTIQAKDADSGVKAIYVNGYEYTEIVGGTINIRLQQFDASYEKFTISAMDYAGNVSDVYTTANPYYTDEEDSDSTSDPAEQLPVSAEATSPTSATAQVTEHTTTGNISTSDSTDTEDSEKGKEFYTIQTESEKVFYLIIDRDGDDETVYFLTEISENDLLNTTTDNSETLPKNSAAVESAIPASESALGGNDTDSTTADTVSEDEAEDSTEEETETDTETEESADAKSGSGMTFYIILGVGAVAVIGAAYVMKSKKKKESAEDDADEDEQDFEDDYDTDDEDEDESEDSGMNTADEE